MAWSPDEKIGWPMQKGSQRRRVNIVAGEMQSWWCEDHEKRPGRWSGFQKSAWPIRTLAPTDVQQRKVNPQRPRPL